MDYLTQRMQQAWVDNDVTQAQSLNRMYEAFEGMTDDEWEACYGECHAQDR